MSITRITPQFVATVEELIGIKGAKVMATERPDKMFDVEWNCVLPDGRRCWFSKAEHEQYAPEHIATLFKQKAKSVE